jgi:hypothetical protein
MTYIDLYEVPESINNITDDDYWNEGEFMIPLFEPEEPPAKKVYNGFNCIKCQEFNKYAEPNQKDGTFKCYSCRKFG